MFQNNVFLPLLSLFSSRDFLYALVMISNIVLRELMLKILFFHTDLFYLFHVISNPIVNCPITFF